MTETAVEEQSSDTGEVADTDDEEDSNSVGSLEAFLAFYQRTMRFQGLWHSSSICGGWGSERP